MKLIQSKNIHHYKSILETLVDDFGPIFYKSILIWCAIIYDEPEAKGRFNEIFLIKHNGVTVGICGLYSDHKKFTKDLWLGWFGILPKYRSCKYGCKALCLLEQYAKTKKCTRIFSYVDYSNTEALRFYKGCGYKKVGTVKQYEKQFPNSMQEFDHKSDFVIYKNLL